MPVEKTIEELTADATAAYELAKEHAAMVRKEWEQAGSPLTTIGHNDIEYEHPLHKVMRETARDAAARLKEIPKAPAKMGRPAVGQISSSISESPASKRRRLKAVK